MESGSLEKWALKELLIWIFAVTAGYVTFFSFEPLFENVKNVASHVGLTRLFDRDATAQSRFNTKLVTASSLPLRGTLPVSQTEQSAKKVVLSANAYGHFHAQAQINGQQVEFMTDTGATYVALSYETAVKLGVVSNNLRFTGRSTTANGVARVASAVLDTVRIGDITVNDVQAVVAEPGKMSQNLLGMSFIGRLSGFELTGSKLTMTE
jgi:clan AA aspartic protease (TIGR02281 family)